MNKALLQILTLFLFTACATVVNPDGGPKDERAPELMEVSPSNFCVYFEAKTIKFVFDEYIKVKNLEAELVSSPPMKTPKAIVKGRLLLVTLEDSIKANTTYTLNFGNAIVDLNEGNPIEDFKYTFSTGSFIDSLSLQGIIKPIYEMDLPEKMWVMAYKKVAWMDSIPYLRKPDYLSRVKNRLFRLENMSAGEYQLIAFEDKNKDYLLNDNEFQGFAKDSIFANLDSAIINIDCYQPEPILSFKGIVQKKYDQLDFGFNREIFEEDSLSIFLINKSLEAKKQQHYTDKDSAFIRLGVGFDSLNVLIGTANQIDTVVWFPKKIDTVAVRLKFESLKKLNYLDTFWVKTSTRFDSLNTDKISLKSDSVDLEFTIKKEPKRFAILFPYQGARAYMVLADKGAIVHNLGITNDSLGTVFTLKEKEEFGTLKLSSSLKKPMLIQLIDGKNKVVKSVIVTQFPCYFDALLPGKYKLRLINDANENGRWDAGDYLKNKKPEPCEYYKEPIEIRANWDVEVLLD